MLALVDNRVKVEVKQVMDDRYYSFVLQAWVPARKHMYLVECVGSDLPCQHTISADRITLLPEGDTPA